MAGEKTERLYAPADLLNRKEVQIERSLLKQEIINKRVAITGAGGSIGSEIARQLSKLSPEKIILIGHGETSIYLIYQELLAENLNIQLVPIIADTKDSQRMISVFKEFQPDIVYHAAAHKHVPLMELNPIEAFTNNIMGTYNVAKAVDVVHIPKMVMVSTDKAVMPTSVMGASKRIAELIMASFRSISQSSYCTVRFGNVLASRGSVLLVFEKQIASGGPLTITDARMTRYLLTLSEASQLVIYAGAFSNQANLFILNMGEPVKIIDLAEKLIHLSKADVKIVETGIRPGEKLNEKLMADSEKVMGEKDSFIIKGHIKTLPLHALEAWMQTIPKLPSHKIKQIIVNYANASY